MMECIWIWLHSGLTFYGFNDTLCNDQDQQRHLEISSYALWETNVQSEKITMPNDCFETLFIIGHNITFK